MCEIKSSKKFTDYLIFGFEDMLSLSDQSTWCDTLTLDSLIFTSISK